VADSVPDRIDLRRHRDLEGLRAGEWVKRGIVLVIAVVLLLALLNVFGERPTTSRVGNDSATLSVYAPDRVRGGLLYTARFHITATADLQEATLLLDPGWIEGMQINSINPQPQEESSINGRLAFVLGHIPAGTSAIYFIEFQVDPTNVGRRSQNVELDDGSRRLFLVHRTITIFP
jgi:hypothetical protein